MSGFTQIGVGSSANDGTGDALRTAMQAVNSNYGRTTRALDSVTDLASEAAAAGYTRIVTDSDRGGVFKAVNSGVPDSGLVFGSATAGWTWQRVYEGAIKATWFDVTADGSTDDRDALRLALLAADGKTLSLPDGVIVVGSQISITLEEINIEGQNSTIKSGAAISNPMILLTSCSKFDCRGVTFDGNSNGTLIGVRINNDEDLNGQSVYLDNCIFKNFTTSNGNENPYGFLAYGSFENVIVENSKFETIQNTAASGNRISKGVYADSASSTRGTKHFFVTNCIFDTITPSNDADAIYHEWFDGSEDATLNVSGCVFNDVAKRCVKSQIKGVTYVTNCRAENTAVDAVTCVDLQYGGGIISDFTYVCNSTSNSPTYLFKVSRNSDTTDGVLIKGIKVMGSQDFDGAIVFIDPESGEKNFDFVHVDDVLVSVSIPRFAIHYANGNDVNVAQVDEINFSNIRLKNLTGEFIDLWRGGAIAGTAGNRSLVNVGVRNITNLGTSQKFYNSGASGSATNNGLNLLRWENIKGITFEDSYSAGQISNTAHTIENGLIYNLTGPNNSVIPAVKELKVADMNSNLKVFDADTDISVANNTITISAHPFVNGEQVAADSAGNTLPTGMSEGVRYYVSVVDSSTIKLFTNPDLVTGEVDITAIGSGQCRIIDLNDIFKIELVPGVTAGDERAHISTAFVKWQTNKTAAPYGSYIAEDWLTCVRDSATTLYQVNQINEVKNPGSGFIEPKWVFDSVAASMYFTSNVPDYSGVIYMIHFLSGLSGASGTSRTLGTFKWMF
jgi:hypothetical protein